MKNIYVLTLSLLLFATGLVAQTTPDNWTVATSAITASEETTTVSNGTKAMKVIFTSTENQDIRSASFNVTGGASFSYTLDVYDNDPGGRVRMSIIWSSNNDYSTIYSTDQPSYQTLTYTGTVPAAATSAYILLRFYDVGAGWDGSSELIIDNAIFAENGGSNLISNFSFENWSEPIIPEYTIAEIQGDAIASPYDGEQVITYGIVTGVFANGYFIQDGTGAWNGIYVFDNTHDPLIGDSLILKAIVDEFNNKTELTSISEYSVNSVDNILPNPITVSALAAADEMYEGVLVEILGAECTVADAGFGEWTIDDGSGAINIDDLMYVYTPSVGNLYNIIGIVDYANGAFKVLPRLADDVEDLGAPIEIAIQHAIDNSSLTINPDAIEAVTGEHVSFDVTIEYAVFVPELPTDYYVDAYITFADPLPEGITIYIVHTGYGINETYIPEAGTTALSLSQMLSTTPALLSGHSGITDVWYITIQGLSVGTYSASISSLADNYTDGPYSTFELASDEMEITVTKSIGDALYEADIETSLVVDPNDQTITLGDVAEFLAVATYPETIDPVLSEYYNDAHIQFESATSNNVDISIVYFDNMGGYADLGTFTISSGTQNIYLSEILGTDRTLLSGHAGFQISWGITIEGLEIGTYTIAFDIVTNTSEEFGTNDYILASDDAVIVVEEEAEELAIVAQSDDTTICVNGTATLFVEAEGTGTIEYEWFFGDFSLEIYTNTIEVQEAGGYYCYVTSGDLIQVSQQIVVSISTPVAYLGEDADYCNGYTVVLNPGEFDAYDWGGASSEPTLSVTESGEYAVIVTDEYGCTATDTVNILFIVDWNFSLGEDVYMCPETIITLEAPVAGTYEWSTEETTSSIEVSTPGEIILTVTQGNCTESDTIVVIAATNPEAFDLGDEINLCIGAEATLSSPVVADEYLWSTGDETDEIMVNETGLYTLTIYNEFGCSVSDGIQVNFNSFILVDLGDDIESCLGQTVVIDPQFGESWLWSDASIADTLAVTEDGTFSVTITDVYGCSGSDEIAVSFRDLPVIFIGNDVTFCDGNVLEITAPEASSYAWNTGSVLQSIDADTSGNYIVTITDEFGCSNSDTLLLTVLPVPVIDLGADNSITEDQTVILSTYSGYESYVWSNDATTDFIVLNGLELGVGGHLIWLTVVAENGCTAYDEVLITVTEGIGIESNIYNSIVVYPNPAKDIVNINFGLMQGNKSVAIVDVTGRVITSFMVVDDFTSIDAGGFAKGMYLIKISVGGNTVTKTIVVE